MTGLSDQRCDRSPHAEHAVLAGELGPTPFSPAAVTSMNRLCRDPWLRLGLGDERIALDCCSVVLHPHPPR